MDYGKENYDFSPFDRNARPGFHWRPFSSAFWPDLRGHYRLLAESR
jgi:hypothetical protein